MSSNKKINPAERQRWKMLELSRAINDLNGKVADCTSAVTVVSIVIADMLEKQVVPEIHPINEEDLEGFESGKMAEHYFAISGNVLINYNTRIIYSAKGIGRSWKSEKTLLSKIEGNTIYRYKHVDTDEMLTFDVKTEHEAVSSLHLQLKRRILDERTATITETP